MAGTSYIDDAGAAEINQARRDILATKIALQEPVVSLVLARQDSNGEWQDLPAVECFRKIEKPPGESVGGDTVDESRINGNLQKEEPFDVQVGDRFDFTDSGSRWVAEIRSVSPERSGIIRADFAVLTGFG